MTLTKAQKLEAYTYAMFAYLSKTDMGSLSSTLRIYYSHKLVCEHGLILKVFPELLKQLPVSLHTIDHLHAIERAIELTEKLPE